MSILFLIIGWTTLFIGYLLVSDISFVMAVIVASLTDKLATHKLRDMEK